MFVRPDGCKGLQNAQTVCSAQRLGSLGLQPDIPGGVCGSAALRQLANDFLDGGRAFHARHSAIGKDSVLIACCGQGNGNFVEAFQAAGKTPSLLLLRIAKDLTLIVIRLGHSAGSSNFNSAFAAGSQSAARAFYVCACCAQSLQNSLILPAGNLKGGCILRHALRSPLPLPRMARTLSGDPVRPPQVGNDEPFHAFLVRTAVWVGKLQRKSADIAHDALAKLFFCCGKVHHRVHSSLSWRRAIASAPGASLTDMHDYSASGKRVLRPVQISASAGTTYSANRAGPRISPLALGSEMVMTSAPASICNRPKCSN